MTGYLLANLFILIIGIFHLLASVSSGRVTGETSIDGALLLEYWYDERKSTPFRLKTNYSSFILEHFGRSLASSAGIRI